ncbi:hypothetical protein BANRA_04988 [Klebsiella pneumoniae]|nr:hypothetical protein BANRA_04988 [Klebsiella pneumoniae]
MLMFSLMLVIVMVTKGFINDIKLVRVSYSLLIVMMGKHIVRWWLQQNPIQPLIFRQMTQCLQVAEMK